MKTCLLLPSLVLALVAAPLLARADANPDFDEDATPLLRVQPGLVQYIHSHFEVKDTGTAKYPGDDDHRPAPPYIFRARPRGSSGPFNLRLLIQPGPPGRILNVVDITQARIRPPGVPPPPPMPPGVAEQPQPPPPPEYAPAPPQPPAYQSPSLSEGSGKPLAPETPPASTPPPASSPAPSPSEPTADTPSGPILAPSGTGTNSSQPSLAPPPDPAPAPQQ